MDLRFQRVLDLFGMESDRNGSPLGSWDAVQRWAEMGRKSLFWFCYAILTKRRLGLEPMPGFYARRGALYPGGPEIDLSFHQYLCSRIDSDWDGNTFAHVVVPRDHFKTTILTLGWTLQALARDPGSTHLIAGATMEKQGKLFLGAIKHEIETNEVLRACYPHLRPGKPWTGTRLRLGSQPSGVTEPTITAVGEGGSPGEGLHVAQISLDDLAVEDNTRTRARAEKTNRWMRMLFPMVRVDGRILFDGTRYADFDAHGELQNDPDFRSMYLTWPAIYDERGTGTLDFDRGDILFPEEWNPARFRKRLGEMSMEAFCAQYLNDPVPGALAMFKSDWMEGAFEEPGAKPLMTFYLGMDTALSYGKDDSAIVTAGMDADGVVHVVKCSKGKWTLREQAANWRQLVIEHGVTACQVETMGQGAHLEEILNEEIATMDPAPYMEYVHWHQNKEIRAQGTLQPLLEAGKLKFATHMKNSPLVEQLARFPKGARDDLVDALTMACDCAIRWGYSDNVTEITTRKTLPTREEVMSGAVSFSGKELRDGTYLNLMDDLAEGGHVSDALGW